MRTKLTALVGFLPLGAFWLFPLLMGLLAAFYAAGDGAAWSALFAHPQFWSALRLSLVTGTVSLVVSTVLALWIVAGVHGTSRWPRLAGHMGGFLSLPHLAFAIGLGFLIMPSGLMARVPGSLAGWTAPPQWITTQDPYGISLVAVLILKEVPFVIWLISSLLARKDMALMLRGHWLVSQSLGHGSASTWLRVFIPQILPRLKWPLIIVWVYGASVVDVALAIGPTQPPPLAVIIWADLNNADQAINARGSVGALFLTVVLAGLGLAFHAAWRLASPKIARFVVRGPSPGSIARKSALALLTFMCAIYVLVLLVLGIMSIAAQWPYPDLLPTQLRWAAWEQALASPAPLINSLSFALACVIAALAFAVMWFESVDERLDPVLLALAVAALALPSLLIADGQYLVFLQLGLNGTWFGVFLAHLTPVFAYVFIVLKGPYRAFDARYRSVSLGLNTSALRFWLAIKMPLLKPALAAAAAIGVGVGMAQYVPIQLIAAGRISTLSIEAVTLASGGNRQLLAVFSLMLAVIPLAAFACAARLGRQTP